MRKRWRLATDEDVFDVVSRLRPCDVEECVAFTGLTPLEYISRVGYDPDNTYVIFNADGDNVALGGVSHTDDQCALIWLIATPLIENHSIEFLKYSRAFIKEITQGIPLVYNWVYAKNDVHIKWLKWCGFTFIKEHTCFGAAGVPFLTFVRIS